MDALFAREVQFFVRRWDKLFKDAAETVNDSRRHPLWLYSSHTRQMRPEFRRRARTLYARPKAKGGVAMRMMLKIMIPTEAGNRTIRDGSLPKILEGAVATLKAEAAYFVAEDGVRTAMIFFDMRDSSDIPSIVEPLFMGIDAEVELLPVMNADDLRKGLKNAMEAM
jgi:hypothetical protein